MSEKTAPQTFSRRASLADFFSSDEEMPSQCSQNQHNKNNKNDNIIIAKNQQEFGHRKRIKP